MIKFLSLSIIFLSLWLASPNPAMANLVVRLGQPSSPTRTAKVDLSYTALNTTSATIQINCQVKQPNQNSFSSFASNTLKTGGDSGICAYEFGNPGNYQFQVVAATSDQTQVSNTVTVEYRTSNPDRVVSYSKSKPSSCEYRLEFTTPSDNRVNQVEIFRSATKEIDSTKSAKVFSKSVTTNEVVVYTDKVPDCDQTYYYAVRTLDSAGNSSGFVGDQEIVTTTPATAQASPAPTSTLAPASTNTSANTQPPNPVESVEELTPETNQLETESTPEPNGAVLGDVDEPLATTATISQTDDTGLPARLFWLIGLVVLFAGVTTGVIIYLK